MPELPEMENYKVLQFMVAVASPAFGVRTCWLKTKILQKNVFTALLVKSDTIRLKLEWL